MSRAKGRRVMTSPDNDRDAFEGRDSDDFEDREFFNVFDGTKGRTESVYLDMQERKEAEISRAAAENREPDLSDPGSLPAATGTPLVPKARQVDNSLYSNPSILFTGEKDVDPVVTLSVDTGTAGANVDLTYAAQVARERVSQDEALLAASESPEAQSEAAPAPVYDEPEPEVQDADTNTTEYTV